MSSLNPALDVLAERGQVGVARLALTATTARSRTPLEHPSMLWPSVAVRVCIPCPHPDQA